VNFHRPPYGTIILPQALSSGTSIHSPAVSHPVNKRILVACIMIPARRRANRHKASAHLVAMSPSSAATLSRIGGAALGDLDYYCTCASSLLSSVAQLHFPIRSPLCYLGNQATQATFAVEAASTGTRPAFCLSRFCPRSCQLLHYDASSPSFPAAKSWQTGKEPADALRSNSKAYLDLGRTKVSSSSLLDSACES
jgi:hypothetical protein